MSTTGYDPSTKKVAEVKTYVTDHPDEAEAIYAAEVDGKNRVTLVTWLEDQPADTVVDDDNGMDGEPPPEITPADPPTYSGRMGEFPLPDERHYFTIPVTSPFGHSGERVEDQDAIRLIQTVVGIDPDGQYGSETNSAVVAWREIHSAEPGEFVDAALWNLMDQTPPDDESDLALPEE
jgi:hypothetical protein